MGTTARKSAPPRAAKAAGLDKLKPHALAELLPAMAPDDFTALKNDVAAHGQRDPIILLDGQILDGRHRYRACCELGIKPKTLVFDPAWGKPILYLYSKSLHRNWNDGQKAAAAVLLEKEFSRISRERMHAGEPVPQGKPKGASRDFAGALYNVSGRYVQSAKTLYIENRKLFKDVFNGKEMLSRAVRAHHRERKSREFTKKADAIWSSGFRADDITIKTGDCLKLSEEQPSMSARLIFADPQYNIGYKYGNGRSDQLPADQYLAQTGQWMKEAHRILTVNGSLWVLICDEWAAEYAVLLKILGFEIRSWIKWFESFGNNCTDRFNRTSRHLFYCCKGETLCFHPGPVSRDSDRKAKYQDARAVAGGKLWDDVWGINPPIPRLVDNSAERIPGFPTQLPLALLTPIVMCASDPGDLVMDFFSGSGTTAVACLKTGRKFLGYEIDTEFARKSRDRVAIAAAETAGKKGAA